MMNLHRLNTRDPLERLTPGYAFEAWEMSRASRTPIDASAAGPDSILHASTDQSRQLLGHMHNCLSAVYRMAYGYMGKGLSAEAAMFAAFDIAFSNVCKQLGLPDSGARDGCDLRGANRVIG